MIKYGIIKTWHLKRDILGLLRMNLAIIGAFGTS